MTLSIFRIKSERHEIFDIIELVIVNYEHYKYIDLQLE